MSSKKLVLINFLITLFCTNAKLHKKEKHEHPSLEKGKSIPQFSEDLLKMPEADMHQGIHTYVPRVIKIGVLLEISSQENDLLNIFTMKDAIKSIESVLNIIQHHNTCLDSSLIVVVERKFGYANGFNVIEAANDVGKEGPAGMIVLAGCTSSLVYRAYSNFMKIPSLMIYTERCIEQRPQVDESVLNLIDRLKVSYADDLDEQTQLNSKIDSFKRYRPKAQLNALTLEHYWYGVGVGYSDAMDQCLVELLLIERIKNIIFYANDRNWGYRKAKMI